jgi:hypothetical protein
MRYFLLVVASFLSFLLSAFVSQLMALFLVINRGNINDEKIIPIIKWLCFDNKNQQLC